MAAVGQAGVEHLVFDARGDFALSTTAPSGTRRR
jgi:hypothetical protein